MPCLFCKEDGPYVLEHVIPESLGNDDVILVQDVCKKCNNHFSKIEEFVLQKSPMAFWRTYLGVRSKSGKLPSVNMSQPAKQKGLFDSIHHAHDNDVGFTAHENGSTSVDVENGEIIESIVSGKKSELKFVFTPLVLFMLGRFLNKVGIELLCYKDPDYARSNMFDTARQFSRYGSAKELWPIFHFSHGSVHDYKNFMMINGDLIIETECYSYRVVELLGKYIVFLFSIGTDNWIVCLNERYPDVEFVNALKENKIKCIWYPLGSS